MRHEGRVTPTSSLLTSPTPLPRRASDPEHRPSFVEIVSRLSVMAERESAARHPELEADFMRRAQSSPAEALKAFRLPPDGPAHKEAMAALERRRCALIQGLSSDGTSGGGSGGKAIGSAPAGGAAGSAPPGITSSAAAGGGSSSGSGKAGAVGSTIGSSPPAMGGSGAAGSSSGAAGAAGAAPPQGNDAGGGAGSGANTTNPVASSSGGQPAVCAAAPAPLAAGADAAAAAVVSGVGTCSMDAPPSPCPVDAGSPDFARS